MGDDKAMKMKLFAAVFGLMMAISVMALAQTARPTTRPAEPASPDLMLRQLLSPARPTAKPLEPVWEPQQDATSRTAVAPRAEPQNLVREGSLVLDRPGRLTRTPEGQFEFVFDSDGSALRDPPMIILPNLKLTVMERAVKTESRDLKFSVSGMVTEYNNRNYILLEKVIAVPEGPTPQQLRGGLDERDRR